jgi:hypothetical protein
VRGGIAPFKTTTPSYPPLPPPSSPSNTESFSDPYPHPSHHHGQDSHQVSGWVIFLEVAGTLMGLVLLAAFARCFWSYRKTPRYRHARSESIMEIRRELMESRRRRSYNSYRPPPPPYRNPPSYEIVQADPTLITTGSSSDIPSIPLPIHQLVNTSEPLRPPDQRTSMLLDFPP